MKKGSKTVKIKNKEVMLKDQSFYKTSPLGNEAATRSFGANLVTHVITGKTYFVMWSMDVKFEGKNVDRHMDLTTSNHGSPPPGTPPKDELEKKDIPVPVTDEKEKCPVCDKGTNPTPGETPAYVTENRIPKDSETLIGREGLRAAGKGKRVKGAKVYHRAGGLIHRDTMHAGKGAELETYNKTGKTHKGAICAHCGTSKGKVDKKKKCDP